MQSNPLLGIFDSGVGGFSVYKKIRNATRANCIYYGDCMRAPYGNREEAEIIGFIKDDIAFLQDKGATHFVNACNSMSVLTTNTLLDDCNVSQEKYVDMIRAFDMYAEFPPDATVLIIATKATIRSGAYQEVLQNKGIEVLTFIYEDLAGAIEANKSREELLQIIERSTTYAKEHHVTHIVYGCTHYPLVERLFNEVKEKFTWDGEFIDPAVYVAQEIKSWNLSGDGSFVPYSSKDTPAFINNVIKFL
jgi:glutamate racemase